MAKTPKFYPAEDVKKPKKKVIKGTKGEPKMRSSIKPGAIVIILAGRFKGKRCVCLKALPSGLLLVSGPYKINGVPLRRVNPAYVIATNTTVDISKVDVSSLDDKDFAKDKKSKSKEGEDDFFKGDKPKKAIVTDKRKEDQAKVDDALLAAIKSVDYLKSYLATHFTLKKGEKPHNMVF